MRATKETIETYNSQCMHYNLVADACYGKRKRVKNPVSDEYLPYLVSALIGFDMQRQMGKGLRQKYNTKKHGFAYRLDACLGEVKKECKGFDKLQIATVDIDAHSDHIRTVYDKLSAPGVLATGGYSFHVGTTRLLHFMYPDLFPIVDSNVAMVLKEEFDVGYTNGPFKNYNARNYLESMRVIQDYIRQMNSRYGARSKVKSQHSGKHKAQLSGRYSVSDRNSRFSSLDKGIPDTRIFDKLAFVAKKGW